MKRFRAIGSYRGSRLARLPNTRDEALHIAEALGTAPEGAVFLGQEATERNVKRLPLADYRYILFATHGLLAGEFKPGVQPALALSFVGDPENDGLLEMGEILGLDLAADLVALSACNTAGGSGEDDRGEGFAGLTRSFMYAGARALLVTQWPVETSTAQALMQQVFQGALDAGISRSLVVAKRSFFEQPTSIAFTENLRVSTAHPFFWAPFILVGEGR
jgi:CHAT domain-containing protein